MTTKKRQHNVDTVRENLTRVVRDAIANAPCSMRALAEEAGVSPALLARITLGSRAATSPVALKVAAALERWSASCWREAQQLRRAARRVPTPRTGRKA